MSDESKKLRLTNLGRVAACYGATTPPEWFVALMKDVRAELINGGDWLFMLDERIAALQSVREHAVTQGLGWFDQ